ncbi:hypothetical protein DQ384_05115 [Sphaerisporangium album]|uniref:DUF7352 domain-containing protein n=1 Tax=Sphaerisporangium album TaxID=509200 RepID=A0A367FNE7_9ACTN|nr:hypothetical protein [Sphaerisporangium album]RCG31926.1 hypothetical protein DQ384_05115 [Sphaerisporangium album]
MTTSYKQMFRYAVPIDDNPHLLRLAADPVKVATCTIGTMTPGVEFWAEWRHDVQLAERTFQVFGTGHPVPVNAIHRGTAERDMHGLVWHLYELEPNRG